jgi:hypothetical protein
MERHSKLGDVHLAKGEAMGFGVGLVALRAAKPAKAIAVVRRSDGIERRTLRKSL